MTTITYALQFRGQGAPDGDRLRVEARAPSALLVSVVDRDGVHGRFEEVGSGEARWTTELDPREGPLGGRLDFGGGTTLTLRATEHHPPEPAPRPYLLHGAAIHEVTGGTGRLAGARGWVTSNFLLSDTGDLTDTHLGLLHVERP